ncbi:MAG: tetratricopeptide repeat protein [Acidimicrobiaceae bacterium]|nr:tetratricopeptide repeat protein [Acidimicrobiaceae bacterium]MYE97455.1 tetratricopeptide repeat protein [Acidimicrobiaceae bacterium]MYH44574.1 tetratricopeptide repeat protein [Acidimicrobiaceae bacterium]MYI52421.1 tetratricopeptide repeat protein [Acidimicrobiaceae bacterium]MYJ81726.1 tetratricopeptide repeat protein [Acidimicrobiaceae bacterium]
MSAAALPDLGPVDGAPASVAAWGRTWEQYLHCRGDPVAVASEAGRNDDSFVMGPVFAAVYRVLAGSPPGSSALSTDASRAQARAAWAGDCERAHVAALEMLLAGEFTGAARRWDQIARSGRDFAAVRFAHDVYLHVGDDFGRLDSSSGAEKAWRGEPGWGFVAGQHAFALEEVGRYDEAEALGRAALGLDPDDLWARHALAHVYESTDDTSAALALLEGSVERWGSQELLATHIWWHLALRLIASGDSGGALAVFDERQPHAATAFQLCDQTSLLWRLELVGCEVGDRWDALADRWDEVVERHTCGFLDVHAALAFSRKPAHPGAARWFRGLDRRPADTSENDRTFMDVVAPLAHAFRAYAAGDTDRFVGVVDDLGRSARRIGGSIVQRDLITLTAQAAGVPA